MVIPKLRIEKSVSWYMVGFGRYNVVTREVSPHISSTTPLHCRCVVESMDGDKSDQTKQDNVISWKLE